jgi:hypothetical protein
LVGVHSGASINRASASTSAVFRWARAAVVNPGSGRSVIVGVSGIRPAIIPAIRIVAVAIPVAVRVIAIGIVSVRVVAVRIVTVRVVSKAAHPKRVKAHWHPKVTPRR